MFTARTLATRQRRALTFIELLLAILGMALIAASMAALLSATAHGANDRTDMRSGLVRHEVTAGRIGAAIRSSKKLLAAGADYLVLWCEDKNTNDKPNLSELLRIERNSGSSELRSYKAPATLNPADDASYDLASTDFNSVTNAVKGTANFPLTRWASGVATFSIAANDANPKMASLVSYRLGVLIGGEVDIAAGAAALRNR